MSLPESTTAAMLQTNALFAAAVKNRDFASIDKVYTADATILPPGAPLIQGRENIKNFWEQAVVSLDVKEGSLSTVSAVAAGETVVEIGRATLTLAIGATVAVKYVVHWKQEDGLWKWHTDIWNTNE